MDLVPEEPVTRAALDAFGLSGAVLTLVGSDWNHTYRVDTDGDAAYALRLYRRGGRTDAEIATELTWMDALVDARAVRVPRPILTRDGEPFALVSGDGDEWRAALFEWIAGEPLGEEPDPSLVALFGQGIARLHVSGRTFRPTPGLRTWDSPFPQGGGASLFDGSNDEFLTRTQRALLGRAAGATRDAIGRLEATGEPPHLVHGDLHQDNVLVDDRRDLWFLDFDDCMLAWPVQDLGVTMWEVAEDEATWPYRDTLRAGYEQIAPWPERWPGEISVFAADRGLIKLDDVLRERGGRVPADLQASVQSHADAITWFLPDASSRSKVGM